MSENELIPGATKAEIARWGWANKDWIWGRLKEVATWFQSKPTPTPATPPQPTPGVLIIGPGGTGKSTLGRLLAGEFDLLVNPRGNTQKASMSRNSPSRTIPA